MYQQVPIGEDLECHTLVHGPKDAAWLAVVGLSHGLRSEGMSERTAVLKCLCEWVSALLRVWMMGCLYHMSE